MPWRANRPSASTELGGVVVRYREQLGLTQGELARRAGITQGFLSRVEAGKRGLSVAMMSDLSRVLGDDFLLDVRAVLTKDG